MKFTIERDRLLKPLQYLNNPLRSSLHLPILANLLLQVSKGTLLLISTNLEVEIITQVMLIDTTYELGAVTVPARKLFDIFRSLPKEAKVSMKLEGEKLLIHSGQSRYLLSTLPASDFPCLKKWQKKIEFSLMRSVLKQLIESTYFSMAQQDIRYCLNGLLFEIEDEKLSTIATDGHRLAICSMPISSDRLPFHSIIMPRRGVIELIRILDVIDENIVRFQIGNNNLRIIIGDYIFTSRLIDGCFPDYRRVLPKNKNNILEIDCNKFRQSLIRAAIFSNERFRGVRLHFSSTRLKITANNTKQEEAEEILDIFYEGNEAEIGFNVNYILDILNVLRCEKIRLSFMNCTSGVQIEDSSNQSAIYIVMPMQI
ncbi:DNA polymerase III subunit beta [Sodalis sp. CWE]|uniref:DNA polymerase III subunit beta n=1 Tax=Sodalis sp. CWE TaxID=2803816 RepID=UPI001C7DA097|nr:DNA polymerase III subunit beta [Sodalis sp. CWE]MBX4181001.1 DNA polymerase III subunit beta [Sodalis sp. CWE]